MEWTLGMSMEYLNIRKDLSTVLAEDKVYKKQELLHKFEEFISEAGFTLKQWIKNSCAPYECLVLNKENEVFDLIVYLKNITGAGWKQKVNRKRAQVSNVKVVSPENYIPTSSNRTFLILGYYNFDENPLMVAWDAYRYIKHNTMRSTYISVDNLLRGYEKGYVVTTDSSQKVWIFDSKNFETFLLEYISYNK